MRADARIRIRGVIVRIQIEWTCIQIIVPIATEIEYVWRIEISVICLNKDFFKLASISYIEYPYIKCLRI